jgi:hypothetical protein
VHTVAPASTAKLPAAQSLQAGAPTPACLPAAQLLQPELPAVAYAPAAQRAQPVAWTLPAYVPAAHGAHAFCPVAAW